MPDSYHVQYSPDALKDLDEIFEYIVQDSPQNAALVLSRIDGAVRSLDILPHRYAPPRKAASLSTDVRSMPVPPFLVRYEIDETTRTVMVLTVRRGTRKS